MREWLRVVSTSKNTYTLRFYNVAFDTPADVRSHFSPLFQPHR